MITLKTLPESTAQEVVDQIVRHMLTQNRRSINIDDCAYRSGDLSCAAGCFIAADEYRPEMEGDSWVGLSSKGIVPVRHDLLINAAQRIHDDFIPCHWREELEDLCDERNLTFNPPTEK